MIFLKNFDTTKQSLYGIGKVYVLRSSKVGDLIPIINERMRWSGGTPLKLFEVAFRNFAPTNHQSYSHDSICRKSNLG